MPEDCSAWQGLRKRLPIHQEYGTPGGIPFGPTLELTALARGS